MTLTQIHSYGLFVNRIDTIRETIIVPSSQEAEHAANIRFLSSQIALEINRAVLALQNDDATGIDHHVRQARILREQRLREISQLKALTNTIENDNVTKLLLNEVISDINKETPISENMLAELDAFSGADKHQQFIQELSSNLAPLHEDIFVSVTVLLKNEGSEVSQSREFIKEAERAGLYRLYGIGALTFLIFAIVTHLINTLVVVRIERLTKKMQDQYKDKKKIMEENKGDEIFLLNKAFDHLLKQTKRYENKLKKYIQKLKSLDRLKDEFMALVSHELKTPLTSIITSMQIVHKNNKNSKIKKLVEISIRNGKRLLQLISDIVDSSRLTLGQLEIKIENIQPDTIFKEMKETMKQVVRDKGLVARFKKDKNLPSIRCDSKRLLQVLRNIMSNSVKYTEKGSVSLTLYQKENCVEFKIQDTGIGIPKKLHKKIFSRFYQVDSSLRRKVGGAGIGLFVVSELVKAMKGTMWFTSTVGKGTTFYVSMPTGDK